MRMVKYVAVLATLVLAIAACGDETADDPNGDLPGDADVTLPGDDRGTDLDDDVAAVVDGEEITAAEVEEQVEAFAANPQIADALQGDEGEDAIGVLRAQVVATMIVNRVAIGGAEELGAPVTDDDIAEARQELEDETGGPEGLEEALEQEGMSQEQLEDQLRALAALRNIELAMAEENGDEEAETRAQEYIGERLQAAEVIVNADYGTWDPQTGQVMPPGGMPAIPQDPEAVPES